MANDEEKVEEEIIEGLELESIDETTENANATNDETTDDAENTNETSNAQENNANEDIEENVTGIQKRLPKLKKILIIAGAVTATLILAGTVLYFVGYFDEEPVRPIPIENKNNVTKTTKITKATKTDKDGNIIPEKKKYAFKVKDINKKRLNRKLSLLTKNEIIEEEKPVQNIGLTKTVEKTEPIKKEVIKEVKEEESQKEVTVEVKEEMATLKKPSLREIEKNKEKMIEEETKAEEIIIEKVEEENKIVNEEESTKIVQENIKEKEIIEPVEAVEEEAIKPVEAVEEEAIEPVEVVVENTQDDMNEKMQESKEEIVEEVIIEKTFLKFIEVTTIKKDLYLSYLHNVNKIDKRVSVCRNNINQIQVFIGPIEDDKQRQDIINKLHMKIAKEAFTVDFTQEEFDKRCKF